MPKTKTIKILFAGFCLIFLFVSCVVNERNVFTDSMINVEDSHMTDNPIISAEELQEKMQAINQYNNLQLGGFSLMLGDSIYFADGIGIHKTDQTFNSYETLIYSDKGDANALENIVQFDRLHFDNGRIYFRDRSSFSIYSMNPDGLELTKILDATMVNSESGDENARITEFIVIQNKLYFNYFDHGISLKMLDLVTGEISDLGFQETEILTVGTNNVSLQFSQFGSILTELKFENNESRTIQPFKIEDNDSTRGIGYSTNSNGILAFIAYEAEFNKIYVIGDNGYAEELYSSNDFLIEQYINTINNWIYFTVMPDVHNFDMIALYRIRNDGGEIELVYENIAVGREKLSGLPVIFINLFSEDIILFKAHPTFHEIYALTRDGDTNSFFIKLINP